MSTVLTREQIKSVDDRQVEFVAVPEWSPNDPEAGVWVHGLTGAARDSFEFAMLEQKKGPKGKVTQEVNLRNLRAKLVVRSAYTSDDPKTAQPVFTEADAEWLGTKSAAALQRVYSTAQRLSGLSNEDVEELTAELGKDQNASSGSDSPHISDTPVSQIASGQLAPESSPSGSSSTETNPSASAV